MKDFDKYYVTNFRLMDIFDVEYCAARMIWKAAVINQEENVIKAKNKEIEILKNKVEWLETVLRNRV
jgi:hypothetical protein